jgi:hypothetical protein
MARGFLNEIGRLANKLDEFAGAAVNAGVALAAKRIVDDLQKAGPSWTGDFKNNWVVAIGSRRFRPQFHAASRSPRPHSIPR